MDSLGEGVQPRGSGGADRGSDPHGVVVAVSPDSGRRTADSGIRRSPFGVAFALLLSAVCCLPSGDARAQNVIHDAKSLATAPIHWDKTRWLHFGEGVAAVLAARGLDHRIQRIALRNQQSNAFTRDVTKLGGGAGEDLAIVMAAGGWLAHDQRMKLTGIEALEADIWASQVVTPLLKNAFRRKRPNGGSDSFPSSHSTSAWALATVIANRYDDHRAVPIIAYSLATSVSLARVNDNVHWASDVVAGALIGRAIGKGVIGRHLTLMPTRHGFAFSWNATMTSLDGTP